MFNHLEWTFNNEGYLHYSESRIIKRRKQQNQSYFMNNICKTIQTRSKKVFSNLKVKHSIIEIQHNRAKTENHEIIRNSLKHFNFIKNSM